MKRRFRTLSILSAAVLLAVFALPLSAGAESASVFIPGKLVRLNVPDMPETLSLSTRTADGVISFSFSEQPDWAGVYWAEGYEALDIDEDGEGETPTEGHLTQPGIAVANSEETFIDPFTGEERLRYSCDPLTGMITDRMTGSRFTALQAHLIDSTIHSVSGDDAFVAGKGPVSVGYGRSGRINYVLLNTETDYFLTGLPGAYTTIRYERCDNEPGWYVSSVETTYQKGDYIAAVQAEYRNDAVNSLGSYRVTYDDGRDGLYTITYAPNSRTVLQVGTNFVTWYRTDTDRDGFPDTLNTVPSDAPTQTISKAGGVNVALIHHDTDEILSGVYVKGGLTLTSGSGKKLGSWYKDRSKQYPNEKYGLRPCTSFPSPRVE